MLRKLFLTFFLFAISLFGGNAEKIFDKTYTSHNFNSSPVTINVKGDSFDYDLIAILSNGTANDQIHIKPNNDAGATKRNYLMQGTGSTAGALTNDSYSYLWLGQDTSSRPVISKYRITGSSGDERLFNGLQSRGGSTSSVDKYSFHWKNTVDELSSLVITNLYNGSCDAHIILYRTPKNASQEQWELVSKQSVTSQDLNTSPISFTTDGDRDKKYRLTFEGENNSGNPFFYVQANSDNTGSNYTGQVLYNQGGSIVSFNDSTRPGFGKKGDFFRNGAQLRYSLLLNAESGVKRLGKCTVSSDTTVQQTEEAVWWSNTASNITSLRCYTSATSSVTGTAKLYRKRNPKAIGETLPFEVVEKVSVNGAFNTGHTFSNLKGDSHTLYKISFVASSTVGTNYLYLQVNGDTGTNYVDQRLYSATSTAGALSYTSRTYCEVGYVIGESSTDLYLYPKSGNNRPILSRNANGTNQVNFFANWYTSTASEITSIKIYSNTTNTLTGTLILSRLR